MLRTITNKIRKKIIHIHIPKTGGTYVSQYKSKESPVISNIFTMGHSVVVKKLETTPKNFPPNKGYKNKSKIEEKYLKGAITFSTVRNIFDWLVSYWGHAGGIKTKYTDPSHYDYALAQKGFKTFVKTIAKREGNSIWPSKKLIHFAIFSYHGDLIVDWINRTRSLDNDLELFASKYHLKYQKKPKQRVGRKSRDYQQYYDEELIKIVNKTWGREQKLFGYDFDGYKPDKAIIKNEIDKKLKKKH